METGKLWFYGGWALKIIVGLVFLAAGGSKLAGVEDMVAVFDQIGFGQWFRYVTGIIEVVGAVLLFVPGRAIYGAGLLVVTMVGAVLTHLVLIGGSAVPALVLLILSAIITWMHKDQMSKAA